MEKNNYLISEMKIEDLENIKDILEVDFDEFWNYETLKEELESNFSKYFIAKQNDNIVVSACRVLFRFMRRMNMLLISKLD